MRQLSLAVVGADFPNKKGPTRRFEIAVCKPGEPIYLVHEPKNQADPRAIAVFSVRKIQIGYLTAERAPMILTEMSRGPVQAIFQQSDRWGATIRAGLGGAVPVLPELDDDRAADWPPPGSDDPDWWPDEEWSD